MFTFVPLQIVDNFLLQFNVGQVLLATFVLVVLGSLPLRSQKILSINAILFGVIFLLTPGSLEPVAFKLLGIALLVVGPVLYATSR